MLWPIDKPHAENSIIPSPDGNLMIFPKSKDAKILAPLSGMVVKAEANFLKIETLSQSKKTKITQIFMNLAADLSTIKEGVFVQEGQPLGVASDNLNWSTFIKDAAGDLGYPPVYVGGLLGGLFFAGDANNPTILAQASGVKEDFIFIAKVGVGSFLAGVGVGFIAPKLLRG